MSFKNNRECPNCGQGIEKRMKIQSVETGFSYCSHECANKHVNETYPDSRSNGNPTQFLEDREAIYCRPSHENPSDKGTHDGCRTINNNLDKQKVLKFLREIEWCLGKGHINKIFTLRNVINSGGLDVKESLHEECPNCKIYKDILHKEGIYFSDELEVPTPLGFMEGMKKYFEDRMKEEVDEK